jgi:putative DNA primase/helicase
MQYDRITEEALLNIDALLTYWGVEYKKVGEHEYDFLSPTRHDSNFGACRFNSRKNRGKDFGGREISTVRNNSTGLELDDQDYSSGDGQTFIRTSFDIIALAQRVHKGDNYQLGARWLQRDLEQLRSNRNFITFSREASDRRQRDLEQQRLKRVKLAKEIWNACKHYPFVSSLGDQYLQSRGLNSITETNVRFHPSIFYQPTRSVMGALIFRVSKEPKGDIAAIHRIFLNSDGTGKANIETPKMALGPIQGNAIWFGTPGDTLVIAEGPEHALAYRTVYDFVVCSVYASNYHAITIPDYVLHLVLAPDGDEAGTAAFKRACITYKRNGLKITGVRAQ